MPGTDLPTPDDIASALNAADFPASKDDLIRCAQAAGADEAVQRALRSLPPEIRYANHDEVIRSIDTMDAQHERTPDR